MFTIYLACLIFGGILLGASLLSFGGNESGADSHDISHDTDLDASTDISHHGSISKPDIDHSINNISKTGFAKDAAQFFSFRNLVFFLAFFGLTGSLFSWMNYGGILVFLASLGMGSFSYYFGYNLMKYLRNSETGAEINIRELIGKIGVTGLPISKDKAGKVIVTIGSFSREYSAKLSESSSYDFIKQRENILVIDIVDNCLIIDKMED